MLPPRRQVDPPVGSIPHGFPIPPPGPPGRVDPPIVPHPFGHHSPNAPGPPPQPGYTWQEHPNRPGFYHWGPAQGPIENNFPGGPGVPLPHPNTVDQPQQYPVAPDHPVSMLQQATIAHARRFRNQMGQVAPLIPDPNFHALLNAPLSLQNHAAAYEYFQRLAQEHGFPDVQTLIDSLIRHQAGA